MNEFVDWSYSMHLSIKLLWQ